MNFKAWLEAALTPFTFMDKNITSDEEYEAATRDYFKEKGYTDQEINQIKKVVYSSIDKNYS